MNDSMENWGVSIMITDLQRYLLTTLITLTLIPIFIARTAGTLNKLITLITHVWLGYYDEFVSFFVDLD